MAAVPIPIPMFDPKRPIPPSRPCAKRWRRGGGSGQKRGPSLLGGPRDRKIFASSSKKYRTRLLIRAACLRRSVSKEAGSGCCVGCLPCPFPLPVADRTHGPGEASPGLTRKARHPGFPWPLCLPRALCWCCPGWPALHASPSLLRMERPGALLDERNGISGTLIHRPGARVKMLK